MQAWKDHKEDHKKNNNGNNNQENYYPESVTRNVRVRQGLWADHQVRFDRIRERLRDVQEPSRDVGQAHRVPAQSQQQQLRQLL
jgi:hypothetical protein